MEISRENVKQFVEKIKAEGMYEFMGELKRNISKHNLTHEQVAHIVGKSLRTVQTWLSGQGSLFIEDAIVLAKFFKMKIVKPDEEKQEEQTQKTDL